MKLTQICNRVIEYSFYLLFFLVPLMMTPFNYELFEFNKMLLVYMLATIITTAWLVKMVLQRRIIFQRTFWDIPLLIFLASQLLSTIFSLNPHASVYGYYSRFHGGLLSTICYLLLYWAFVSFASHRINPNKNPNKHELLEKIRVAIRVNSDGQRYFVNNCSMLLLLSGLIVSVYGILEHFGIDANYWVQDVKNRVFSSLGQPNWLAAWLVAIIPLNWAIILDQGSGIKKKESEKNKTPIPSLIIHYSLFIVLYLCLLFTKSRSGLIAFGFSFSLFWGVIFSPLIFPLVMAKLTRKKLSKSDPVGAHFTNLAKTENSSWSKTFVLISLLVLLTTVIFGSPWTPSIKDLLLKNKVPAVQQISDITGGGTESGEIRQIVWKGAIEIWKHSPILGSGVETFAYSYYNFRPREHNDVSEWDFLYNKAHNEYLNFLATTGIVGLGSYLLLIATFGWWFIRVLPDFHPNSSESFGSIRKSIRVNSDNKVVLVNPANRFLTIALFSGFVSILVTNFFGFSVVAVALLFFLFPALAFSLNHQSPITNNPPSIKSQKLIHWQMVTISFLILLTSYLILNLARYWYADFLFAKGDKLNQAQKFSESFSYLERAVRVRPKEPFYRNAWSLSTANLAVIASEQNEATLTVQLTDLAVNQSDQTIKLNPHHLNFWKTRIRVFYLLAEIDSKYFQKVLESLNESAKLAPTDAKIFYNLAVVYTRMEEKEKAIGTLQQTIKLKPNYDDARYALALLYEEKGENEAARYQLKYILEKINPNHEAAKKELEKL